MNPVFKKLNFKDQKILHIVNAPDSFRKDMAEMAGVAEVRESLKNVKTVSFFLAFVTKQQEVDTLATRIATIMIPQGVLWFAYPKGTSKKYKCEFNRDNGWKVLGQLGYEGVRMVAIDEDWSALRFRKAAEIKTMTRNFAMSDEGKKKVAVSKTRKKS